jgi:hypothetical protein
MGLKIDNQQKKHNNTIKPSDKLKGLTQHIMEYLRQWSLEQNTYGGEIHHTITTLKTKRKA